MQHLENISSVFLFQPLLKTSRLLLSPVISLQAKQLFDYLLSACGREFKGEVFFPLHKKQLCQKFCKDSLLLSVKLSFLHEEDLHCQ